MNFLMWFGNTTIMLISTEVFEAAAKRAAKEARRKKKEAAK